MKLIYSLKLSEADGFDVLYPFGIPERKEKNMKELSGGELQSVAIAACLCHEQLNK